MTPSRRAHAAGLATVSFNGTVLDTWYPSPLLGTPEPGAGTWIVPAEIEELADHRDELRETHTTYVHTEIDLDKAPASVEDAYLRLHLLSHTLVKPGEVNLNGLFSRLPDVVWTSHGPVHPETYSRKLQTLRRHGVSATGLDRFPRFLDYVVPAGVRIADSARVRLGAHLAPGTTVAHEGFVNYNAGTLGASVVEGRLSQGVVVGNGSDIGGGASVMGGLTIGERALLGANSGIGISLGDDTVVEAGLYVTAGTQVWLPHGVPGEQGEATFVKAATLAGTPKLLFRRNSRTGAVEALPRA